MISDTTPLAQTFTALSDSTRIAIIERLTKGETTLSEVARPFEMSQTAVTKHVKILSDAGLVKVSKRGRTRYCALRIEPMKRAEEWLETYQQFWRERFDNLSSFLDSEMKESRESNNRKPK